MSSIFSLIAAGEIPSYKVASDDKHYAFLDINPVARGHVLVIPRREEDYLFNLPAEEYTELMLFARRVAKALEKAIPCKRIGVAVMGLEVPHVHVHLVPLQSEGDMDCANKKQFTPEEMARIAETIAAEFE